MVLRPAMDQHQSRRILRTSLKDGKIGAVFAYDVMALHASVFVDVLTRN